MLAEFFYSSFTILPFSYFSPFTASFIVFLSSLGFITHPSSSCLTRFTKVPSVLTLVCCHCHQLFHNSLLLLALENVPLYSIPLLLLILILLGTTYSCVANYEGSNVEIIANEQGSYTTPSFVSFTDKERLIGEAAKNQAAMNPANTVFDIK